MSHQGCKQKYLLGGTRLDDAHFTNHSGLAIVSKPGINFSKITTGLKLKLFEHLCCRISRQQKSHVLAALY